MSHCLWQVLESGVFPISTTGLQAMVFLLLSMEAMLHLHSWDVHFIYIITQNQEVSTALSPCHNGTYHPATWL